MRISIFDVLKVSDQLETLQGTFLLLANEPMQSFRFLGHF